MTIPLVDLRLQYASIKNEIDNVVSDVLGSGDFILGAELSRFEAEMAAYCGARYAVGVGSGTEALHLALKACGVGPGDEVITTAFTFIATADAVLQCGATPVFADIEPSTCNLDWRRVEVLINERTRAILPVHLYGHPVDMDPLLDIAKSYRLKVVEDCAQALGARYKGVPVGSQGDVGCFSFFPSKNLGAYGDGGMVVTSDEEMAKQVNLLRQHGSSPHQKYYHLVPGFNSRLDNLQAAILRVKLGYLDSWVSRRREKARYYDQLLSEVPGVQPPITEPWASHAFNYYTLRLTGEGLNRDRLKEHLSARGIAAGVYYPLSLHLQPAFEELGHSVGDLAETEQAQNEVLSLPMYPELDEQTQERVVETVREFTHTELVKGHANQQRGRVEERV